ncbi:MAG: response regulator [Oceanihabitans sp.]
MSPSLILADDHPLILNGTKTYLENLGYNVIGTALDGQKAYNKIVQLKPDIALLDYDMPKLNGIEIAEEVKRNKLHCKIIILTLHKQVSLIKEVGKTIHGYITKDSALEEFETCIATILKGESYIGSKLDKSIPFAIEKNTRLNLTKAEKKNTKPFKPKFK